MKSNRFLNFITGLIILMLMASILASRAHLNPITAFLLLSAVGFILSIIPLKKRDAYQSAIQVELWVNYIIERLWKDNGFLKNAWNDDDKVLKGKIVHIPNPGAAPNITKNRTVFPATAVRRTDTDITYNLDEYTTDPTHIEDAEKYEVSYDKINSILGDHMGFLTERVADGLLLNWLDESVTVPTKTLTTGALAAATTDDIGTALTGTRRVMLANDIKKVMTIMNLQKIPKEGRFALIESNMYDQLLTDLSATQYRDFSQTADPKNGVIGKLYTFTLLDRNTTFMYDTNNALKAYGAASATTDNLASLFWQKDCVSRAMGEVKFFSNVDRPEYYGDIYSALLRMGGRRRRGDDKGVVALIQAAV